MSAGWVAAGVRGQGLARSRLGHDGACSLATTESLADALAILVRTPYGREVRADMDLIDAQQAVAATVLWHLRILAGWAPSLRSGSLRLMAAGFEIANVTGHMARLAGQPAPAPFALGSLAMAWPMVSVARTPAEVRTALRTSVWGDPGSDDLPTIRLALQLGWTRRILDSVPAAADWAISGTALVLARVLAVGALPALSRSTRRDVTHILGPQWQQASCLDELARCLPRPAAQALRGVNGAENLWRAEVRWWATVESTGAALAARPHPGPASGIGVVGLLAADAWRTRAALAIAARGGGVLSEVLDAVA